MEGPAMEKKTDIKHPNNKNIVLLKKSTDGIKNLFLVHDGTGRIEGYFRFSVMISNEFTVYGVSLDECIGLVPKHTTIGNLARNYVEQIKNVQPEGPYYIAGWSIGGSIGFEIVNQLEKENDVGACVLFDTPPPGYYPKQYKEVFSVASEKEFVCNFITNEKLKSELINSKDIDWFWSYIKNNLKEGDFDRKEFISSDKQGWAAIIPNIEHLPLYELFYRINIIRTLHDARILYFPNNKLKTTIHFFNALDTSITSMNEWDKYCEHIVSCSISGSHYSIFNAENLNGVAEKFNSIVNYNSTLKEKDDASFVRKHT